MSARETSDMTAGERAEAPGRDLKSRLGAAASCADLSRSCETALQRLYEQAGSGGADEERDSQAIRCLLDGTGFMSAGVARFSDDAKSVSISTQSNERALQETTILDIGDVSSARAILTGAAVNIPQSASDDADDDAMVRGLGASSFFAEPIGDGEGHVVGYLFFAGREPVASGGLVLRTFLSGVGVWLQDADGAVACAGAAHASDANADRSDLLIDTLQNMGVGIIVFDAALTITAVNDQTHALLNAPQETLHAGASMLDLINHFGERGDYGPEAAQEQISKMRQVVARREPHSFERTLPDGRIISCKAQPRAEGYVVTYTDVTEYYAREHERLEHGELLSDTLNHMEQGLIVFDADLEILAVNEQANVMLDVPRKVLKVGSNMDAFVSYCAQRGDYGDADPTGHAAIATVKQGNAYTIERQFGNGRTVVCAAKPRSGGGYIATYTDVTQWRKSERELDTKSELLSVALDYMDQGLIVYDSNLMIEAFNDRARTLLEVPEHTLQAGASMLILLEVWIKQAKADAATLAEEVVAVRSMVSSGEPFASELVMPGGQTVSYTGRPRDKGGYVLTLADVTASKLRKRELADKTSMMEAIVQHMDQGLLAFDGHLKLLFANERAKMMLGVPRELFEPGQNFEKIVRESVDRGEGSTVDQMLARVHGTEPFSFERKCTGNTTALVRFHPRPEGGYIVTYTDITATRRQQDELSDMAEALRQKSVQLDTVFTNMGSGVAMFDANVNLVICNPRYQEIFQLPDKLVQPGVALSAMYDYSIEQGLEDGATNPVEQRSTLAKSREPALINMRMADGRIIHAVHEPLDDGGSISVYEDVTVREAAEQKLRDYAEDLERQKSMLQTVMEHMDQGISLADGDLNIQAFNSRFLELLEFPKGQFKPGDSIAKFFRYNAQRGEYGPGDEDEQVQARVDLAAGFEPHCFVRERPDGTAIEIEGKPLPDSAGFVTTYTDITEARRSEMEVQALAERLTETNLRLDAAFNNMNQGLAMFDEEHRLVVRNKSYLDIFQFPEDVACEGAGLEDITRYSVEQGFEADPERAIARRMEIAAMRERAVYHRSMSDGRIVEIIHEPLESGGSLALYLDVTKRETAERSLREHASKLEASNRELQEFAYVAAHDLQEPLRKIEAFGDRLQKKCGEALGEDGQRYVTRMQASSRRLRSLIDALLDYSRVTTKAAPFKEVDLQKLALSVVSDLEMSIEKADAIVELTGLPTIAADENQLRQLFLNLVSNALKFRHEERQLKLRISAEVIVPEGDEQIDGETCVLSFADNGIGFDPKYADRIFTIFQRLHSRAEYEGTGIGLATCRKIVERHHGSIESLGTPGEGAEFRVTLPVNQEMPIGSDDDVV